MLMTKIKKLRKNYYLHGSHGQKTMNAETQAPESRGKTQNAATQTTEF